jgi:hypothetical protein
VSGRWIVLLHLSSLVIACRAAGDAGIQRVAATETEIVISGSAGGGVARVEESQPYTGGESAAGATVIASVGPGEFTVRIPRFEGDRDRVYSAFGLFRAAARMGPRRFVQEIQSLRDEPYPVAASKKGIQVAMVDDALALGIKHAALNVWLNSYIDLGGSAGSVEFKMDGRTFHFRRGAVEALDRQVKPLADAGVIVTFILLYHRSGDAALDALMLHPRFDPKAPNGLSAFNVTTPQATEQLKACFEFLAERYSRPDRQYGRAVNFIVGNEVDSHFAWYNLGRVDLPTLVDHYARAVRLCQTAVRKYSSAGRVFLSLDHFWNLRYRAFDETQSVAGRALVEAFQKRVAEEGDFDWNVAYHPYPENLFEPRFWLDKTATFAEDTPRITFKNVEMLPRFLDRPAMRHAGKPRRVILSEQGFHTPRGEDGERVQAAAYAYAYYRINRIAGIDAFILHRQVDHSNEGGLHLGLWWDGTDNPRHPGQREKKMIYDVFRAADTPGWREAFRFALPVVGVRDWEEAK